MNHDLRRRVEEALESAHVTNDLVQSGAPSPAQPSRWSLALGALGASGGKARWRPPPAEQLRKMANQLDRFSSDVAAVCELHPDEMLCRDELVSLGADVWEGKVQPADAHAVVSRVEGRLLEMRTALILKRDLPGTT